MKKPSIAIVGLGRMGANIARRLHDLGYPLAALYDVYRPTAEALAKELESRVVASLREVTDGAEIILTLVPDDAAMRMIYQSPVDNLLMDATGKLFLNLATVSPAIHRELATEAATLGAGYLETPMASSVTQAREGTLYLMIGGSRELFTRAEPLLRDLATSLKYIGPMGTATQLKALVNMVMNINTAGLAEGLGLADALGLDLETVTEVFAQTGANSRVLQTDGSDMVQRDHSTYFSAAHAAKDSGIALALAAEAGLSLPLAAAAKRQYDQLVHIGCGEQDKSSVAELTFKNRQAARALPPD
jgi:3-hydroxyisobutyrate dehydrogenase